MYRYTVDRLIDIYIVKTGNTRSHRDIQKQYM